MAAIFKAILTRLFVGSRPFPIILSPLILLSGHSRSQETKWSSVSHLLISHPASLRISCATGKAALPVRSCPLIPTNLASRKRRGPSILNIHMYAAPGFSRREILGARGGRVSWLGQPHRQGSALCS